MSQADKITAFFSYARVDWEADPAELGQLFQHIEAQTRVNYTAKRFEKWLDQERLKWSDDWHKRLHAAITQSDLFFVFLSPGWLASDVCREELDAFLKRQDELGGERVFVAKIRDLDEADEEAHAELLNDFNQYQFKKWQAILLPNESQRKAACQEAGKEIAARLKQLAASTQRLLTSATEPLSSGSKSPPVCDQDLASGDFHIPNQGGEVDGRITAWLRLAFVDQVKVTTSEGTFVFGATSARLNVSVVGGRLFPHPEFANGPHPAEITTTGCGRYHSFYRIAARDGVLCGPVLSTSDEHVPLLQIEREGGAKVQVSGKVDVWAECIDIDGLRQPANDGEAEKVREMRMRLAEALLDQHGRLFELEGETA